MGLRFYRQLIARRCGDAVRPPAVFEPYPVSGLCFEVET